MNRICIFCEKEKRHSLVCRYDFSLICCQIMVPRAEIIADVRQTAKKAVNRFSTSRFQSCKGRANSRSPTMHQGWMMYIRSEKTRRCLRSAGTSDVRNANRNKLVGSRAKYMLSNRESQECRRSAASAKRAQKDRRNPTMLVP